MEYTKYDGKELTTVYDLDKCLLAIKKRNDDNEETIRRLTEENKLLKSEHFKDIKLQEMNLKLAKMEHEYYYNGFPINDTEITAIKNWMSEHKCKSGAWAYYRYVFEPTEIGTIGIVKCSCGAEFEFRSL